MGEIFRKGLRQLKHPLVAEVRGKGLLNALVIQHKDQDAAWKLCLALKNNGLLAKPTHGDKIRFAPPLVITETQVNNSIAIIDKSLSELD